MELLEWDGERWEGAEGMDGLLQGYFFCIVNENYIERKGERGLQNVSSRLILVFPPTPTQPGWSEWRSCLVK